MSQNPIILRGPPGTFESTFREETLIFVRFEYAHRDAGEKLPLETCYRKNIFLDALGHFWNIFPFLANFYSSFTKGTKWRQNRGPPVTFESTFREENLIFVRPRYAHRVAGEKLPLETCCRQF